MNDGAFAPCQDATLYAPLPAERLGLAEGWWSRTVAGGLRAGMNFR